jgi:hypothetical protein
LSPSEIHSLLEGVSTKIDAVIAGKDYKSSSISPIMADAFSLWEFGLIDSLEHKELYWTVFRKFEDFVLNVSILFLLSRSYYQIDRRLVKIILKMESPTLGTTFYSSFFS